MSNIDIRNSSSCLEFLGDCEIRSIEVKNGDELNGNEIIGLLIDNDVYELVVSMNEGKKEGIGMIVREDGTLFMRMMFVNDECEGEVTKMNKYGNTVLKGRVSKGKEVGMWIEYDNSGNEVWRGLYQNGKRYVALKEQEGMKGFYSEISVNGDLLSVSEYDDKWMKNGICFEVESGHLKRECVYENGRMKRVIREFIGRRMILFDDNGKKVYEGVWFGDMVNGFVIHPEMERMDGFFKEVNMNGDLLSVSEYDESGLLKNGKCFEYEGGRMVRECEYKNGVMMRVLREWKGECMIEYDDNGMRVYEGGFEGDMMKGFVREGKGKEYGDDGNEFLYSTGYLNGTKDGKGRSLKSDISAINYVHVDPIKRFADGYGTDLSVFSCDCLKGIQKLEMEMAVL